MVRPVVVGIDGSQHAERALVWAAEAASRAGAQLLIAHGGSVVPKAKAGEDEALDFSRDLLREAVATAMDVSANSNVNSVLRAEHPAQLLLELSDDAQMLVVGTHGLGRLAGALLGSIAYRVAAHARCPVVVVPDSWRPPADAQTRVVAVGLSGSTSGQEALEFAFIEAERRGVPLVAIRSWVDGTSSATPGDLLAADPDHCRRDQQDLLTQLVEAAWSRYPGVEVVTELSSESVYHALMAVAGRADLLVLGCRHADEHRFSRLGPIASRLLHTSPCPVAVVGHLLTPDDVPAAEAGAESENAAEPVLERG